MVWKSWPWSQGGRWTASRDWEGGCWPDSRHWDETRSWGRDQGEWCCRRDQRGWGSHRDQGGRRRRQAQGGRWTNSRDAGKRPWTRLCNHDGTPLWRHLCRSNLPTGNGAGWNTASATGCHPWVGEAWEDSNAQRAFCDFCGGSLPQPSDRTVCYRGCGAQLCCAGCGHSHFCPNDCRPYLGNRVAEVPEQDSRYKEDTELLSMQMVSK